MGFVELFLLAIGLSMDAFAVSVCKGLATERVRVRHMLIAGLWFGGFQALMPTIGYLLGTTFATYIERFDHWIAFVLLLFLGVKMVKEALSAEEDDTSGSFGIKVMFLMAVATSIDALAVGITFALLPNVNILAAVGFIGLCTFGLSAFGVKIGNIFGLKYKSKAEILGGVILILIGCKILLEHLGFLG